MKHTRSNPTKSNPIPSNPTKSNSIPSNPATDHPIRTAPLSTNPPSDIQPSGIPSSALHPSGTQLAGTPSSSIQPPGIQPSDAQPTAPHSQAVPARNHGTAPSSAAPESAEQNLVEALPWEQELLEQARGPLPVSMTNDYLFRALLQRSQETLAALLCALLHLEPDDITQITILNPVELGKTLRDKEYLLDIKLELNQSIHINLEMQVIHEKEWPERSLCYLCRTFDSLNHGEDYEKARAAIQIGILDFTLFRDCPEFLSDYYLMNVRNSKIYSDKFRLTVLDLTQRHLATKEDTAYRTDRWAALFKATTWEELKMLAKTDPAIHKTVVTIRQLTLDEQIRMECEAHEEYLRREAARAKRYAAAEEALAEKEQVVAQTAAERDQAVAEAERLRRLLQEHGIEINEDADAT